MSEDFYKILGVSKDADEGTIKLGNSPHHLASALYKLVYGSARVSKESLKPIEGMKAFFANDPSRASGEIRELSQIDIDGSGTIDINELLALRTRPIKVKTTDKFWKYSALTQICSSASSGCPLFRGYPHINFPPKRLKGM